MEMLTTANLSRERFLRSSAGDREHKSDGFSAPSRSPLTREMSPACLKVLVRACGQFDCFSAGTNLNDVVCISKVMFFHSLADEDVHLSYHIATSFGREQRFYTGVKGS